MPSNNSGDITIQFAQVPRRVNVTDSFGNLTLVLPPGATTYRVSAHTQFGSTAVLVPQAPTAASVITASNNSGDIPIVNGQVPPQPAGPAQGRAGPLRAGRRSGAATTTWFTPSRAADGRPRGWAGW